MARTLQEVELHIATQSERIIDLDQELIRRRLLLRCLCEEKKLLCELPIGYVVAFTRPRSPQKYRRSLQPIPIYLRHQGQTHTLTKCGGHVATVNRDGTLGVGIHGLLATLAVGGVAISCGGVMIRYSRTLADAYRDTVSFGEIKVVI